MDKILYILNMLMDKAYNYIKYSLNILCIYPNNVTDLIYWIVQVLKEDLERLTVSIQNTGLMEPVKL